MKNSEIKKLSWADKLRFCRYGEQGLSSEHEAIRIAVEKGKLREFSDLAATSLREGNPRPMRELAGIQLSLAGDVFDVQRLNFLLEHYRQTLKLGRTPTVGEVESSFQGGGDTRQFRRELNLPFLDGGYLRSLRCQFSSLKKREGRPPTCREFSESVDPFLSNKGLVSAVSLDELIALMAEPFERDWTLRWSQTSGYLPHLVQLRWRMGNLPMKGIAGGIALYSLIAKLGGAVEEINLGTAGGARHYCILRDRISNEAQTLGVFPGIGELLLGWEKGQLSGLSSSLNLSALEKQIWEKLNSNLNAVPPRTPMDQIASMMPEFEFLISVFQVVWEQRDLIVLHERFSEE